MDRISYIFKGQDEVFKEYQFGLFLEDTAKQLYTDIEYKKRIPDFLGKTVKVTEKQFPKVYQMSKEICTHLNIELPDIYVFEDKYYGAQSYGIDKFWIEVSAKTIYDFTDDELKFVLARELYMIADRVTEYKTLLDQRLKGIKFLSKGTLENASKLEYYHWYRMANYSADNFGYLMCGNIKTAIYAILKRVLNNVKLANQVDLGEFIRQAAEINKLDDDVYNYTKADEKIPYAPLRMQNLISYAISNRGMKAMLSLQNPQLAINLSK